jgi:hypothetical protein
MVPFALYNPISSGVDCVISKVSLAIPSSGSTLSAGSLVLAADTDTGDPAEGWGIQTWGTSPYGGGRVPSTGVTVAATPCFIGNPGAVAARVQAFAASGTTGVTVGTLVSVRPLWAVNAETSSNNWQPKPKDIDLSGDLVLAPGTTLAFTFVPNPGASTAQVQFGVTWSERPVVQAAAADQRELWNNQEG